MKIEIKKLALFLVVFNILVIFKHLPFSITAAALAIVALSFIVIHKRMRSGLKVLLLVISLILIKLTFKIFLVTEAGVSLVLILSCLKLWEMDNENDHFNMFLILALLECCLFLLNPTFVSFSLGLLKIIAFFYFILKIRNYELSLLSGKRLLFLIAPSLLLSMLLFYTFPRFTQGFLSTTGNKLRFPGTESHLNFNKLGPINLSSRVAFKVFGLNSKSIPLPFLYWRQNVLWDYYKEEWRTGYQNLKSTEGNSGSNAILYKIQLSGEYNEFLPVLDGTTQITKSNLDYNFYSEMSYRLKTITRSSVLYSASTETLVPPVAFSQLMERKGLRLKSEQKEQIKNLILKGKENSLSMSDHEKLDLVIDFFKQRHYEYSLNPPLLNSLEEFILMGRSGYCSHFAAAFAYMARAVDLPARIISGYQGGEINPYDQSLIVRELDGHVWNEIYLKDTGWYRFDPTALVAPGRIQQGASSFNDSLEPYINLYYYQLPKSFLKFATFNNVSLWLDSLNSIFDSNIFNFDREKQQKILNAFIPQSLSPGVLFALLLSGSMPIFWLFLKWLSSKKTDPVQKRYNKFITRMKKEGIEKLPYESALAFQQKCLMNSKNKENYINSETANYIKYFYEAS